MNFKSEKVEAGFPLLHSQLRDICWEMLRYCFENGMSFVITETVTTAEEDKALGRKSTSHREGRAVDIRTGFWPAKKRQAFMDHFDALYGNFGAVTPAGETRLLVFHDSGHGEHIHCQLHSSFKTIKETT